MDFNKKTLSERIAEMLKTKIDGQEYKDGKLPKEEDLAKELKVSRGTVRSAMAILEDKNLIVRVKKKGTFVKGVVALLPETQLTKRINLFFYSHISDFRVINNNDFYGQLFSVILSEATKRGYVLNVSILNKRDKQEVSLQKCLDLSSDGNIFMALEDGNLLKGFLEYKRPCLLVDHQFPDIDVNVVNLENHNASKNAIRFLYKKGHRRFLFFNHHRAEANVERSSGVYLALQELGVPNSNVMECFLSPGVNLSEVAMSNYLENGGIRHSVIVTFSADMALGAMNALAKAGFSVPSDMSVLSLSNMSEVINPMLSTVDYDIDLMGRISVNRMIELIESSNKKTQLKLIDGEIVDRGSVKEW